MLYQGVAERLAGHTVCGSVIARDLKWRRSLVGWVGRLVSDHRGFVDDLWFRFKANSMVIARLAVRMAILHPSASRAAFDWGLDAPRFPINRCGGVRRAISHLLGNHVGFGNHSLLVEYYRS